MFQSRFGIYIQQTGNVWTIYQAGFPVDTRDTEAEAVEKAERLEEQEAQYHNKRHKSNLASWHRWKTLDIPNIRSALLHLILALEHIESIKQIIGPDLYAKRVFMVEKNVNEAINILKIERDTQPEEKE